MRGRHRSLSWNLANDFAFQLRTIRSATTHRNASTRGGSTIVAQPLPTLSMTFQRGKPTTANACSAARTLPRACSDAWFAHQLRDRPVSALRSDSLEPAMHPGPEGHVYAGFMRQEKICRTRKVRDGNRVAE